MITSIVSIFQPQPIGTAGTIPTPKKETKKYLVHPKEWIVGLVLLAICGILRVVVVPARRAAAANSNNPHNGGGGSPLLNSAKSIDQAWNKMRTDYCKPDIEILCGAIKPAQTGGCFEVYKPALSRLWRMQTASANAGSYNCSLSEQMRRLDDENVREYGDGVYLHPVLSKETWPSVQPPQPGPERVAPVDGKIIVKSIIYSILYMWKDAETYFPDEAYSIHHRSSSHTRDERKRMVKYQINNILRVYQGAYGRDMFLKYAEIEMEHRPLSLRTLISYIQYAIRLLEYRGENISMVKGGAGRLMNYTRTGSPSRGSTRRALRHSSSSAHLVNSYSVPDKANINRITDQDAPGGDDNGNEDSFYSEFLPMISSTLDDITQAGGMMKRPTESYAKFSFSLFGDQRLDFCIFLHVRSEGALITNLCELAVDTLPHRLQEIEMESGGDFAFITHMIMFGANLACLFSLFRLFSSRKRTIERMDKGKRRLEQELNDPVLRQALERKAQTLPNPAQFIANLERKAADWDSKAAALPVLRQTVKGFRVFVIFTIVVSTAVFMPLYVHDQVSSTRYLETTMLSLTMIVLTYTIDMDDAKQRNARDVLSAIEIATLDPSTTEALLPNDSNNNVSNSSNCN